MNDDSEYPPRKVEKWLQENGFYAAVFMGREKHAVSFNVLA